MWTIDHAQKETISLSLSHQSFHSRSSQDQIRSKGISHSSFPFTSHQDSLLIILELPTSRRGFKSKYSPPRSIKELVGLDTSVASRHWSQLTFSIPSSHFGCSCCLRAALPFCHPVVAVASGQHSHSSIGCRCCFKAPYPSHIPSLAVALRQQSRSIRLHHSFIQASILSTVPSLESLQTPWNTALHDLIVPSLHWYPTVCTPAVFYQGKKATCSLQLITLQGT